VLQKIKTLGASLVVISPQLEKYSRQVVKKHKLAYPVLSDHDNRAATTFGLTHSLGDDLKALYKKFNIDLERFNGNTNWQLPLPARYILNQDGVVIDAEVNPDYTRRPEPSGIIDILKSA